MGILGGIKRGIGGLFGGIKRKLIAYIVETYIKHKLKGWFKMFNGKKTYILSIVGTIVAVGNVLLKVLNGQPISVEDVALILGAVGLGTLRAGVAKLVVEVVNRLLPELIKALEKKK